MEWLGVKEIGFIIFNIKLDVESAGLIPLPTVNNVSPVNLLANTNVHPKASFDDRLRNRINPRSLLIE